LNLDKTGTNNIASNVCLELLQVYNYLNLDKTGTNNLASKVCLELLQVYNYLNLDKTGTNVSTCVVKLCNIFNSLEIQDIYY
jgi:hypothetical protein